MLYKFKDKDKAIIKLNDLFNKRIIDDVFMNWDLYCIKTVNQQDFYKFQVESQNNIDKYKEHLINQFE